MKLEHINTANDLQTYIEGIINDYEYNEVSKDKTVDAVAELVIYFMKKTNRYT